jgi:hypothetical protein
MRGYKHFNFEAFDEASKRFRKAGWNAINPAELDRVVGIHEYTTKLPKNFLRDAMKRDTDAICDSDAIALLPGWEESAGVKVELTLAKLLELDILDAITMKKMKVE